MIKHIYTSKAEKKDHIMRISQQKQFLDVHGIFMTKKTLNKYKK